MDSTFLTLPLRMYVANGKLLLLTFKLNFSGNVEGLFKVFKQAQNANIVLDEPAFEALLKGLSKNPQVK